ncbi:MAG: hypothetical protein ACE3L7_28100 [Candidatus Pristimantibacillus sp.]
MGTRLWVEQFVKQRFPHVRYIRIHSCGSHQAVIYAWDENLQLTDKDAAELNHFASEYLSPQVCYTIKPYQAAASDRVFPQEVPERLRQVALNGSLDQTAVFSLLNSLFAGIIVNFKRYDVRTGTIHMAAYSHSHIPDGDKSMIQRYANELMPVGSTVNVIYYGI